MNRFINILSKDPGLFLVLCFFLWCLYTWSKAFYECYKADKSHLLKPNPTPLPPIIRTPEQWVKDNIKLMSDDEKIYQSQVVYLNPEECLNRLIIKYDLQDQKERRRKRSLLVLGNPRKKRLQSSRRFYYFKTMNKHNHEAPIQLY